MRRHIISFILLVNILIFSSPSLSLAARADLEKDLMNGLARSRVLIAKMEGGLREGTSIIPELGQIKACAEVIKVTHLLLQERYKVRQERVKALGRKAIERHNMMQANYQEALEKYLIMIDDLEVEEDIVPGLLEDLRSILDILIPRRKGPIYGSLPYRNLRYAAKEPSKAETITPSYRMGNQELQPGDLNGTPEAPLSQEIASLAESLNWNPVHIYEWVKNNIDTEWYWGCMKGAQETLRQKSGNDCDQAALLVALLRASGFPSRYVRGTIEFFPGLEKAKNLIGVKDASQMAAFFQKAGIPFKPIIAGGRITNFQIEHIWVESMIPKANYRGNVIDEHGKTWLALDTSIKAEDYLYYAPQNIIDQIPLSDVRHDYLSTIQEQTPIEYVRERVNEYVDQSHPGLVYEDLLRTKTLIPETIKTLPEGLQFKQITITHEYTKIPDELKHKAKFKAADPLGGELFNIILDTFTLSNRSIALTYEPETVEDQEIINFYGGLDKTPCYLVRLRPVLTIDKERIVVGQDGLSMGENYTLILELISPDGTEQITNTLIMGNLSVIGVIAQNALILEPMENYLKDAEWLLYEEVMQYIAKWNQAENELASLLNLSLTRPIPTVVTMGGVIDVDYLIDMPHGFEWKGVYVDADLRAVEVVEGTEVHNQSELVKTFMQLSGLQGSLLEGKIMEEDFQVESVSTAKLFSLVNNDNIPILTIDINTIDTLLFALALPENIIEDITDAVNQGLIVRIPEQEIAHEDWTGYAYIKEDTRTGESGWMLSGQIAGAMTALARSSWNPDIINTLTNPFSEPANYDPTSAFSIQKRADTDLQQGTVGEVLGKSLEVLVRDKKGKAVSGADVIFTIKAGGGILEDVITCNHATSIVTKTNDSGIASVNLILGKRTGHSCSGTCADECVDLPPGNPTMSQETGDKYPQQIGENIVDTALLSGVNIATPFIAYAFPDKPHRMKKSLGNESKRKNILSFAGAISVIMEDKYCNPLSNLPVKFEVLDDVEVLSSCDNKNKDTRPALLMARVSEEECLQNKGYPTYGECGKKSIPPAISDSTGTSAIHVLMGGTPDGRYTIEATYESTNKKLEETFHLDTEPFGNCDGNTPPETLLRLVYTYRVNHLGRSINAAKKGESIPLEARIYAIKEGEEKQEVTFDCDNEQITCPWVVGSREYDIFTDFKNSIITFNGKKGESSDRSRFKTMYKLKSGVNTVWITGRATIEDKRIDPCPPNSCEVEDPWDNNYKPISTWITVYGVDIKIEPTPFVCTDKKGYVKEDYDIKYEITPAEYQASTAYVAILKDGNPFAIIPSETNRLGIIQISRGFKFDSNSNYKVEVVLNAGTDMEIKSDSVRLEIGYIYIEQEDPEFPNIELRWDDYYPPLGDKTIIIKGGGSVDGKTVKCKVIDPEDKRGINTANTETEDAFNECEEGGECEAEFKLSGNNDILAPNTNGVTDGIDSVTLEFNLLDEKNKVLGKIEGIWNVKNNSNTTLKEVMDGKAVFVQDPVSDKNHKGESAPNVPDEEKKIDFVQELLNQVVPRKRNLDLDGTIIMSTTYYLIDEHGGFEFWTSDALRVFKKNFGAATTSWGNTSEDNSNETFQKLMKDYDHRNNMTEYFYKIIDKETLVGEVRSDSDIIINGRTIPGSSGQIAEDTGLYELYDNVVVTVIGDIIQEALGYTTQPTDNWKARTGEGPRGCRQSDPPCPEEHGPGMSYSFGCGDSINGFNTVANCRALSMEDILALEDTIENPPIVDNEYRGNIGRNDCEIGNGTLDWAGLTSSELNRWVNDGGEDEHPFHPFNWAGIDCSAFAQRAVRDCEDDERDNRLGITIKIPRSGNWIESTDFFIEDRVFLMEHPDSDEQRKRLEKKLRKGELIYYEGTSVNHISIFYSDKPVILGDDAIYQIIHAFGVRQADIDNDSDLEFSRKVVITPNRMRTSTSIGQFPLPKRYGRIKLW